MTEFPRKSVGLLYAIQKEHDKPVTSSMAAATPRPRTTRGMFKGKIRIVGDIVNTDFSDLWELAR